MILVAFCQFLAKPGIKIHRWADRFKLKIVAASIMLCFKTMSDRHIFVRTNEKRAFFAFLLHYKAKHDVKLLAFSLMSNHVHLLLENSPKKSLAIKNLIRDVKREFAKYFNIRFAEKGHVFSRSYRKRTIISNRQFLNNVSYILNNPVKAGMVDFAEHYRFSSSHLILRKKDRKTEKDLKLNDLRKLYKLAKSQPYGAGLEDGELAKRGLQPAGVSNNHPEVRRGRKNYKTRGPFKLWFEAVPKNNHKRGSYLPDSLSDRLPKNLNIHPQVLRNIVHKRAETFQKKSYQAFQTYDGHTILYEGQTKAACFSFQQDHYSSIPINARTDQSIMQNEDGVWMLVVLRGRPPNHENSLFQKASA